MWFALFTMSLAAGLSCLDASGRPMGCFSILKSPKKSQAPPEPGQGYLYFSPLSSNKLEFQKDSINQASPLTKTVNQLNTDRSLSYVIFK